MASAIGGQLYVSATPSVTLPCVLSRLSSAERNVACDVASTCRKEKILILVRHAESQLNAARKQYKHQPWSIIRDGIGSWIDPGVHDAPLTQHGQKQAQSAGKRLARDILKGYLPPVEIMGVSPLRRTLHTSRLIADNADAEAVDICLRHKSANPQWWKPKTLPDSSMNRVVKILPFLRERRTTSADQPLVTADLAVQYWQRRGVNASIEEPVGTRNAKDSSPSWSRQLLASTLGTATTVGMTGTTDEDCSDESIDDRASVGILPPPPPSLWTVADASPLSAIAESADGITNEVKLKQALQHFFTVGLTRPCRKVEVETVSCLNRRILDLERWVYDQDERVILIVGHSMVFRAWQQYWQNHRLGKVQWATRLAILNAVTDEWTSANSTRAAPRFTCCNTAGDVSGRAFSAKLRSDSQLAVASKRNAKERLKRSRMVQKVRKRFRHHRNTSSELDPQGGPQDGALVDAMRALGVNSNGNIIYDCGNAQIIVVRWTGDF